MRRLFQNLIANALKFHKAGEPPRVRISAQPVQSAAAAWQSGGAGAEATAYRVSVEDNGIGFDEKYLERIFAPFQRLHGRGEYEGSGMGLAICRRIVERHHGSITATSAPGRGATFLVTLPVTHGAEAAHAH
jgi:signal transduction histidine kinase